MISGIYPKYIYDSNGMKVGMESVPLIAAIVTPQETNSVFIGECKQGLTALAGPMELVLSNRVAISCRFITNTTIQTPVIKLGSTNTIVVPEGKTLHFMSFGIDGYPVSVLNATLIQGSTKVDGYDIYGGSEFDGPLTIVVENPDPGMDTSIGYTLAYYITDQAVVLPDQAGLQSPTGSFEIQLQKSSDLENWNTSVVLPRSSETKEFYRLQIAK